MSWDAIGALGEAGGTLLIIVSLLFLAYQVRQTDKNLRRQLQNIHHSAVADCTNVERKVLRLLEGGCQMPLGVYCEKDPIGNYHVWAALADSWSSPLKRVRLSSSTHFELADQTVAALRS